MDVVGNPFGGGQLLAPSLDPGFGAEPAGRTTQMMDRLMAQLEQVPDRQPCSQSLIMRDDHAAVIDSGLEHHQGNGGYYPVHRRGSGLDGGHDDDPVDRVGRQVVQAFAHTLAVDVAQTDQGHPVPVLEGSLGYPVEHSRRPVLGGAHADDTDVHGLSSRQGAGGGVTPVAQHPNGVVDATLHVVADVRATVQHPGDGLLRDAGETSNFDHAGWSAVDAHALLLGVGRWWHAKPWHRACARS